MLLSLCLLNILGYDAVEDVDRLEADEGLCRLVGRHEARILGVSRRKLKHRHRKGRKRTFPSRRSLLDWLRGHHDDAADRERTEGEAYVPVPSAEPATPHGRQPETKIPKLAVPARLWQHHSASNVFTTPEARPSGRFS